MLKKYTFWLKASFIFQLLTAALHSLSFINHPQPQNDSEKQMTDLMSNYKMDFGGGFTPTMENIVTSLSIGFYAAAFIRRIDKLGFAEKEGGSHYSQRNCSY